MSNFENYKNVEKMSVVKKVFELFKSVQYSSKKIND